MPSSPPFQARQPFYRSNHSSISETPKPVRSLPLPSLGDKLRRRLSSTRLRVSRATTSARQHASDKTAQSPILNDKKSYHRKSPSDLGTQLPTRKLSFRTLFHRKQQSPILLPPNHLESATSKLSSYEEDSDSDSGIERVQRPMLHKLVCNSQDLKTRRTTLGPTEASRRGPMHEEEPLTPDDSSIFRGFENLDDTSETNEEDVLLMNEVIHGRIALSI
ncbi:hypothetical protein CYLTODRAFT_477482 [Cylindrobasidium torrendii FP15055 ss-10]|uniref:Uncharacterized protein n=1 Tax=Cylindrobasidium torrendii FP15055 ss-10 TaxID=1314674 RepID=A0A0D7BJI0_9AGAR|nr:hypothetical protein CYLTODRAFT_477482 [Cylindrobasidium torrendii FP15055 ss-10]